MESSVSSRQGKIARANGERRQKRRITASNYGPIRNSIFVHATFANLYTRQLFAKGYPWPNKIPRWVSTRLQHFVLFQWRAFVIPTFEKF